MGNSQTRRQKSSRELVEPLHASPDPVALEQVVQAAMQTYSQEGSKAGREHDHSFEYSEVPEDTLSRPNQSS